MEERLTLCPIGAFSKFSSLFSASMPAGPTGDCAARVIRRPKTSVRPGVLLLPPSTLPAVSPSGPAGCFFFTGRGDSLTRIRGD